MNQPLIEFVEQMWPTVFPGEAMPVHAKVACEVAERVSKDPEARIAIGFRRPGRLADWMAR